MDGKTLLCGEKINKHYLHSVNITDTNDRGKIFLYNGEIWLLNWVSLPVEQADMWLLMRYNIKYTWSSCDVFLPKKKKNSN